VWDESAVLRDIALATLKRLYRKRGGPCYFILDDTQVLKRAKKMEAVGRLYHHATGRYGTGHTILKVCLWYRGVTVPWGSWLYVKKDAVSRLRQPFRTLTELAAEAIRNASLPERLRVVVLFDAYYLCRGVVKACAARKWHFIGVGRGNRSFRIHGQKKRMDRYGSNVLRLAPISHLKALMRRTLWHQALKDIARHVHDKPVLRRLEKLLAA